MDSDLQEEQVGMKRSEMVEPKSGWSPVGDKEGEFKSKMVLAVEFIVAEREAERDFKVIE